MKKYWKILFFLLSIMVFAGSIFLSFNFNKNKTIEERKIELERQKAIKAQDDNSEQKETKYTTVDGITNILLIGADYREGEEQARSDTMIILTIDTVNDKIKFTSLLRDMLVSIPGYGKSKLNHSFAYGGEELLMETIEENFGIHLDKYAIIDFNTFKEIIDKLGGVEVDVKEEELDELNKYIFDVPDDTATEVEEEGVQTLAGAQALSFVRIRYNSGGEERRTERQREVLSSLYNKFKDTSVTKYPSILKSVISNVKTNLSFTEMLNLAYTGFKLYLNNIETLRLPYDDLAIGGIYKDCGWVFRTDLEKSSEILNSFIWRDKKLEMDYFSDEKINYFD